MENKVVNQEQQDNSKKPGGYNNRRDDKRPHKKFQRDRQQSDLEKRIISIRRVAKTYHGGKRMRLSVFLVVGDGKGKVGLGIGKGADVVTAEEKAFNRARKSMLEIKLKGNTIAHEITFKKGAAKIFMKPAAPGTGIIASGALRAVFEVAGIKDILSKVIGTSNKISNAYAAYEALQNLKN